MLVAEVAQRPHEFRRSHVEATFALNRFDDDGGDPAWLDIDTEQVVECPQRL